MSIKISNVSIVGWEDAIRGMRNPMNSWAKSDSYYKATGYDTERGMAQYQYHLGPNDADLASRLAKSGSTHRKFMRMVMVYLDITAPLYWWKEFDTYKVGTVSDSCSTMHKLTARGLRFDDFSCDHLTDSSKRLLDQVIFYLNTIRQTYLESKDKNDWWQLIQLLPSSYNQKRTVMLSYEVLANIYPSRKGHKLDEWRAFCNWAELSLPYSGLFTGDHDEKA